ncbi:MAG TPA: hypothetical protein VL979_05840 [Solirubrobacteraceae bacterium]|nr:hypothetical protein [Solirubrobacteraceae bacterium]
MEREERQRAVAGTESVFRDVNEAIERGQWPGEQGAQAFRCECARGGCTAMLELTAAEYERVRAHPRRFVLAPGHEDPAVEDVIERHAHYVLVHKRGQAGELAQASDPRA